MKALATIAVLITVPFLAAQTKTSKPVPQSAPAAVVERGKTLFGQNCAFCHGREGGGGESGPDLMDSDLVASDVRGNKIGPVVRNGRPENGMPAFKLSPQEISELAAFLHAQKIRSPPRGPVDGAVCRSAIFRPATSRQANNISMAQGPARPAIPRPAIWPAWPGVIADCELEKRMLYPRDAPATVTVTLPSGQTVSGKLAFQDEFTIGLTDEAGWYQSWPASSGQVHDQRAGGSSCRVAGKVHRRRRSQPDGVPANPALGANRIANLKSFS